VVYPLARWACDVVNGPRARIIGAFLALPDNYAGFPAKAFELGVDSARVCYGLIRGNHAFASVALAIALVAAAS
jgi:hypothetical protein